MKIAVAICIGVLAAGAAYADRVVIGYRTYMATFPFNGCWNNHTSRCQDLALKDEGLMAGTVTRWEWYASSYISEGGFKDFWVQICHTSRDKLVADFERNYDGRKPARVFADDELRIKPPAYTWFGFDFSPTFEYNGEDNLIIEVHWKERSGGPAVGTYWTPSEGRCCMYAGPVPCDPAVFDFVHYMRVTISPVVVAPTSLGRVKAVFR